MPHHIHDTQVRTNLAQLGSHQVRHQLATAVLGRVPLPGGEAELAALEQAPANREGAVALAEVLVARAGVDVDFRQALEGWWERSALVRTRAGNVANLISGGAQYGPVIQGRDFTGLTFGATPPPVPPGPNQDA